ncbi:hypothetical protein SAMN04489712_111257 [Thermomonospora echinospora]|uniref:DoxX protein n=1 Tax=Thermomonospora echinospora TaxID=1992 RepID=A0A1H6CVV8_9ACTN|nr:hypothetical protein [Thermomonospora echinospora]SEG77161.1 hypothetical protein SAMN04489712_111257 [Thermomonospora echinospora]
MRFLARTHQLPARMAAGALILHSGLSKKDADEQKAAGLHGMAAGAYPFLKEMDPAAFTRLLSCSEIALGAALLLPVVPSVVAGAALTAFSAGLLGFYLRTPGMRREGSVLPTEQGLSVAKDVWLLGIGASLLTEELTCGDGHRMGA